jgi:hypothetical protein
VPPFKACGQNDTTEEAIEAGFNTTWGGNQTPALEDAWFSQFALILAALVEGCDSPCDDADVWFELVSIPEDEEIHLYLDGGNYTLDACNITKTEGEFDASTDWEIETGYNLTVDHEDYWTGLLHFSSPGTYTLGFYVECPETTCFPGGIVASKVQSFVAHQDKDAAKIILEEKWNLISLPLHPFDTSLTSLMAAWDLDEQAPTGSDLISIHHFDQCTDTWSVYGNGQTSLSTMEAGKSYWVRMIYPTDDYTLWVWGTAKPMPPEAPAVYTMCDGWNMFGFTSLLPSTSDVYLWNFDGTPPNLPYPLVYKWENLGDWTTAKWVMVASGDAMSVGEGFWGYFTAGGSIVP